MAVGLVSGSNIEHRDVIEAGEPGLERREILRATLPNGVQALELLATDRRIDVAQAIIDTERQYVVHARNGAFGERTIDPEGARLGDFLRQVFVARDQHAAVAGGDVLDGIERKGSDIAEQTGMYAVPPGSQCECAILDNLQAVRVRNLHDRGHVTGNADEMHQSDRPRPRRDRSLDGFRRDVAGRAITIHEHRTRSDDLDRVHGGHMALGRDNDLVAGADAELPVGEVQRRRAVAES